MSKNTIKYVAEILGLIGLIIVAWLFLSAHFVNAQDYYKDNLVIQESFVDINIDILEDRIERANKNGDVNKAIRLGRRLVQKEQQQSIIIEKRLSR